jgi:ribonuclease D
MIITTDKQLYSFCQPLLETSQPIAIGMDTEFVRQHTFWPKLCLIQIIKNHSTSPDAVIIDPLSGIDLSPIQNLLVAPHITKVIHSARQDLEIFWHEWKTLPQNFFDTQIAAMVCGFGDGIGYSTLVKMLFDLELEKESQFTDWSRRPLSEKQLNYALADVLHLLPTYEILKDRLNQLDRFAWMEDDITTLLSPSTYQTDPKQAWLRIHSHRHKPQNLAFMQDVCAWREINATRLNVNRGRLLRDECILKIGLNLPTTAEELTELADSNILDSQLAQELLDICQNALQKPKELWPQAPKKHILSTSTRRRLERLREKLNQISQELNVPPRVIAPKSDLIALAEEKLEGNRLMTGWRYDVFGKFASELLHSNIAT